MSHKRPEGWRAPQRYEDRGELGRGGMSAVERVFDARLLRHTAMKRLDPREQPAKAIERFVEEAQISGQLEHPNIIPVHDVGLDEHGRLYLNLKMVRGQTLAQLVRNLSPERRADPEHFADLVGILLKVCDAIAYAHSRGVIHRDLKPANVMVGDFGQVYVLDWGIAHVLTSEVDDPVLVTRSPDSPLYGADEVAGTPSYLAPEQADPSLGPLDTRTDVFALGALLYFCLTGRAPYGRGNPVMLAYRAVTGKIDPAEQITDYPLPAGLAQIAMQAMSLERSARHPSASAFQEALLRFLRGGWNLEVVEFAAGEVIVAEGDPGDTAYIIRQGRCAVIKVINGTPTTVRELGPGEVFGETAIFANRPRSATVEALWDCVLLRVDRAALSEGLGLNEWMGSFVQALARRFIEMDAKLHGG